MIRLITTNFLLMFYRFRGGKRLIMGTKTFYNGTVKNLTVNTFNDKNASNIVYKTEEPVRIKGNVIFSNPLKVMENVNLPVDGTVNDVRLKDELVMINSTETYEGLHFERIKTRNVNVKFLNGHDVRHGSSRSSGDESTIVSSSLFMPNTSISVKNLNGEPFDDFIKRVYLKKGDSQKMYFVPGTTTVLGVK